LKNIQIILLFLLINFNFIEFVEAQRTYSPTYSDPLQDSWRWKLIPELRGKGVRCMAETNDTIEWFGTDNAILRYNGLEWQEFNSKNSCLTTPVNILFQAHDGILYAGSDKGIYKFSNNQWSTVFLAKNNTNISTTFIKTISNGSIVAGISQGLLYVNQNQKIIFTTDSVAKLINSDYPEIRFIKLPSSIHINKLFPRIDDAFEFSPNEFWILLSSPPDGKVISFNLQDLMSNGKTDFNVFSDLISHKLSARQKIVRTTQGKVWLISAHFSSGIFTYENNRWNYFKLSEIFGGDDLHTSILEANDGSIWIGSIAKIFVLKDNKWSSYESPNFPIPYSRIILHKSKRGSVWIAGLQNEVYYLNYSRNRWSTYKNLNYECESNDGKKWFLSVDNKVVYNDKDKWFYFDATDSTIDSPVKILASRKGTIWIAGSHKGIAATAYLENNKWHKQLHPALSWGVDYRSVFEDINGSIWFGASVDALSQKGHTAGIIRLSYDSNGNKKWNHFNSKDGITQMNCYGVGQSSDGRVFMGGTSLLCFDGIRWGNSDLPEPLKMLVNCIYNKPNQKMWVGSRFYGLYSFDGKKWEHFSTEQGLASNSIISIYAINDSSVWVATDNGICRYDGKSWLVSFIHPQLTLTREGGSILVGNDGTVWINKSLREWKRRAFTYNIAPKVAYENFYSVLYKPDNLAPDTRIKLYSKKVEHSGNTLISWEGIDYWEDTPSNQLAFSYRLNSSEWSDFKNISYQTFTALPDGNYTFEVRARDFDFNVDKTPARIYFVVTPPVWKQAWFIILVLCFIAVISFSGYQILNRNKKLAKLNLNLNKTNSILSIQREENILQQQKILEQKNQLEVSNLLLENQNKEIITQRDKLEEMVHQVEELSQTKLNFFTNVSHEFRTPLTLLLGPLERLIESDEPDATKRKSTYHTIFQNAQRLLRLINQLLEFRKIEFGKISLNLKQGNIVQAINDIFSAFKPLAIQKNINYQFQTSHSEVICSLDYDKVDKIVENLLSNAFKYTPENGTITIQLSLVNNLSEPEISHFPQNTYIQILVSDNGKGILQEELTHIFDRFFQSNDKNKVNIISSGLGLSYIKELIELHKGKIYVRSEHGKGSSFYVYLPFIEIEGEQKTVFPENYPLHNSLLSVESQKQALIQPLHSKKEKQLLDLDKTIHAIQNPEIETLLVIEDDHDLLNYLNDLLSGYHVILASNGDDGWEKAVEIQPDLIISDVMMPGMSGIDLCRNVKTNLATSHIPVILLTARALIEHKIEGIETGADAYMEKPFNEKLLIARVKNLIDNRKLLREKFKKDLVFDVNEVQISSADEKLIKNVMQLIEKNIDVAEFNIEEMCKNFYLSRSHFSRKIKQITSLSPIELLTSYRLRHAAALISQKKLPISEIAYRVGFEHPNSLSRAFKKEFGMSTSEYSEKK